MSFLRTGKFPGFWLPGNADRPQGNAKSSTTPTSKDGSPWAKLLIDDYEGAFQGVIARAGITLTGNPDTAIVSDYIDALHGITSRRFNSIEDIAGLTNAKFTSMGISQLIGWQSGTDIGGGFLYFDSTKLKSAHDGGVIFSPTVPWSNTVDYLAGVGETDVAGSGCWIRIVLEKLNNYDFGSEADGIADDTQPLLGLDGYAVDFEVDIFGTVLFQGPNLLNTFNYIFAPGAEIVDIRGQQIVMFDADNKTIVGLQHNHLLEDETTLGSNLAQTSGDINPPPPALPSPRGKTDILAYWYQDFGLEYIRSGNGANGGLVWYYWDWNFATNTGDGVSTAAYNSDRRPLLGYYRGDDVNVLGWQCYWLAKYGVTGFIAQNRIGTGFDGWQNMTSRWQNPTDTNYWLYQLFTNVPNFHSLQYQLWGFTAFLADTAPNRQIYTDSWTEVIQNIYLKYPNFHYVKKDGGVYPALFLFEGNAIRTTFGNNVNDIEAKDFLIAMAALFKAAGYSGMAVFARKPTPDFIGEGYLESNGVLYYSAEYSNIESGGDITDYEDYFVDNLDFSGVDRIRGIQNTMTSRHYVFPHPSTTFLTDDFTPDLFRQAVSKSIQQINETDSPDVLTIYNVSEWAEGGPGLQPNVQDGFLWLEALSKGIRDAGSSTAKKMRISTPLLWKAPSAGSQRVQNLEPNWADVVRVQVDFSTDEISDAPRLPNIIDGKDGDKIRILVGGSNQLRLVDDSIVVGTHVKVAHLGGATSKLVLAANQTADFVWSELDGLWICTATTGTPV